MGTGDHNAGGGGNLAVSYPGESSNIPSNLRSCPPPFSYNPVGKRT